MLTVLDPKLIAVDQQLLDRIERRSKSIFRAITFCRKTSSKKLLDSFMDATTTLAEILSIKNAQMEASCEEEVVTYTKNLKKSIVYVVNEIKQQRDFHNQLQLFQIFRIISPEAHERHPNRYRNQSVRIGNYLCPDPKSVQGLVSSVFENMKKIANPLLRAIYWHHELIRIHPFVDGNGRTVRIAKNWMLMYNLYPPIFIKDQYGKQEYIQALSHSFNALEKEPNTWHDATHRFFVQELHRVLFSITFIVDQLTNK